MVWIFERKIDIQEVKWETFFHLVIIQVVDIGNDNTSSFSTPTQRHVKPAYGRVFAILRVLCFLSFLTVYSYQ